MKYFPFIIVLFLMLNSCDKPEKKEINLAEVKLAIAKGNARYMEANEKGDAAMFASLFADEGIIVHPNVEPLRGKNNIQAEVARIMSRSRFSDWEFKSLFFSASGTQAYELIQYRFTLQPEGKNPIALSGKYLMIWKQQLDETWKIQLQMAQSND